MTQTIPEGWEEVAIGDMIDFVVDNRGKTPPLSEEGEYELLEVNAVTDNSREPEYIKVGKFVDEETFKNWFRKGTIKQGDILIPTVGTIGNVAYSKLERGAIAQNLIGLRTNDNNSSLFVYYFLSNPLAKRALLKLDIGGVQPSIKVPHLLDMVVDVPSNIEEQQAIASVLSSLDDKIELLREQNKTLENIAQTLFHEWFVKFNFPVDLDRHSGLDPESPGYVGYADAGGEMVESELGDLPAGEAGIPKGWRVGKVREFVDLLNGFAFKSSNFSNSGKYKLVTIANVQDGSFVKETKDRLDKIPSKMSNYCHLSTGDILMSLTGNVGRICHVVGERYLLNQRVAKLKPKNELDFAYVYIYFRQQLMITKLENISSGTAQQNLSPIKTSDMEALIPTRNVLDEYSKVATPLVNKMLKNYIQIETLSKTRDTLLPKLMSGDVRVRF